MAKKAGEKGKSSEVISVVAHQLKNPISVIKGYLEILSSKEVGEINEKQAEYLADCLENLKRMSETVSFLLDVSKIEENQYELRLEKFSLEDVVRQVIKDLEFWAKATNSEIIFRTEKDLPDVFSDPKKVRMVVENLISNALEYKGSGQARIDVSLRKKGNSIVFSCKDQGIGISKTDAKKIFSKFYRSAGALKVNPSGTGLGLYISKSIIGLGKGKIWFEKNKGLGATFYFTLPIYAQ